MKYDSVYPALNPEVTSEVTPPKKNKGGRPKKVLASPSPALVKVSETSETAETNGGIEPVKVVFAEPEPALEPAPQALSPRTLAEIEAGQRTLDKYRR